MFGIKWNNKLKPSKVAAPKAPSMNSMLNKFPKDKGIKEAPKAWDVKGYKSASEKAAEAKQKALDEETVQYNELKGGTYENRESKQDRFR